MVDARHGKKSGYRKNWKRLCLHVLMPKVKVKLRRVFCVMGQLQLLGREFADLDRTTRFIDRISSQEALGIFEACSPHANEARQVSACRPV